MRASGLAALALILSSLMVGASVAAPAEVVTRFADPAIIESSGLVVEGDTVVTVNDSGDSGRVFTVDSVTGQTIGVTSWEPDPEDVEALAPAGAGEVWVADIGDNGSSRASVTVRRVPVGPGNRVTTGAAYSLTYPDGSHDAEALLAHPETGGLYVVTKSVFGGQVYAAPQRLSTDRPARLRPVADVLGLVTDGAFVSPGIVVLRNYSQAEFYALPAWEPITRIDLPGQQQGEGIAAAPDGSLWLSSEGSNAPVLRVPLPPEVRAALRATTAPPSPPAAEATTQDPPSTTEAAPEEGTSPLLVGLVALGGLGAVVLAVAAGVRARRRRDRRSVGDDLEGRPDEGARGSW